MRFALDRWLLAGLVLIAALAGGRLWLRDHPAYDPWAPLRLADAPGSWVTTRKIAAVRSDPQECRAFLRRSGVAFTRLDPTGEGSCRREDRQVLGAANALADGAAPGLALRPAGAQATCAIDAALVRWLRHGVQPAAKQILSARVVAVEHYGTNNCRRIGGGRNGSWSEHATGNAIDVAAFKLDNGRRIAVRREWTGEGPAAAFLHQVRDAACGEFATVLSPDYNAAHADHLHLDQAQRPFARGVCR
ncbi:extensin family protein [Novosphingobium sp. 9U]|uniref:extensin-like domain-containing protein n=1 Tax=Novosphingobium sp. 9U TaxID=2653158 RepID=UPI0012F21A61|nr:extensin family protein [Novosphingobium sp. 9U]VWX51564.1 Extensin [Novosphingobium sp. 9U]